MINKVVLTQFNSSRFYYLTGGIILVLILVAIFYSLSEFKPDSSADTKTMPSEIKEVAGLNNAVTIGNLSFKLFDVSLQKEKGIYAYSEYNITTGESTEYYYGAESSFSMFWSFVVTNNGDRIENVSDCGILLFEDGSQYNFEISQYNLDISGKCNYYDMVPGAKREIHSIFYFSNPPDVPYTTERYWLGSPKLWENVPGSKITYFSQQSQGLVRYTIEKKEIRYTNNTV